MFQLSHPTLDHSIIPSVLQKSFHRLANSGMTDKSFMLWALWPSLKAGWESNPKLKLTSFNYTVRYLISPNSHNEKTLEITCKSLFSQWGISRAHLWYFILSCLWCLHISSFEADGWQVSTFGAESAPPRQSHSAPRSRIGGQAVKHTSAKACLCALSPALQVSDPCSAWVL